MTVKTVKKKQKHKGSGTTRTITKTVQSDSFFNFFNPPTRKWISRLFKQSTLLDIIMSLVMAKAVCGICELQRCRPELSPCSLISVFSLYQFILGQL